MSVGASSSERVYAERIGASCGGGHNSHTVVFAHVAGIPVEETAMYFAPVGVLAFTIGMRATWRKWMQRLRRRDRD
jgi:hypothetical protein